MKREEAVDMFKRTRLIWSTTYAFVAGMNAGRGSVLGVVMVGLGGVAILLWVHSLESRMVRSIGCEETKGE